MKKHVFVSYSHNNSDFADDLVTHLVHIAKVPFWIDRHDISYVDASFEEKIREALEEAWGAILIASPDARKSKYVQSEVAVMNRHNITPIVLWIDGEDHTDAVPFGLTEVSFIDCRADAMEDGLSKLTNELLKHIPAIQELPLITDKKEAPEGFATIDIPFKNITLAIFTAKFANAGELLLKIFTEYLADIPIPPFTYGKDWVIGLTRDTIYSSTPVKVVPAFISPANVRSDKRDWHDKSLKDYGLTEHTRGILFDLRRDYVWKIIGSGGELSTKWAFKPDKIKFADGRSCRDIPNVADCPSFEMLEKSVGELSYWFEQGKVVPVSHEIIEQLPHWCFVVVRKSDDEPQLESLIIEA